MSIKYKLKSIKEDFIVNEVSLLPFFSLKDESKFTYIILKKSGMTTFDAMGHLVNFFKLNYEDVSAEGLKDEDGITTQLISIKKILEAKDIVKFNKIFLKSDYYSRIEEIRGYGNQSLLPRLLHGNSFEITIRDLDKKTAEKFQKYCLNNRHMSFVNYYDNQRFGIVGGVYNTHLIGKAIIENNWVGAFNEFKKSKNEELKIVKNFPKLNQNDCRDLFKKINPSKIAFFISSYESYIWNKKASEYLGKIKNVREFIFPKIGKLAIPDKNIIRVINIFSCMGYSFDKNTFTAIKKEKQRNLIVNTTVFPLHIDKDELNKSKYKIMISFFLPTGCYATMIIKQIFLKLKK